MKAAAPVFAFAGRILARLPAPTSVLLLMSCATASVEQPPALPEPPAAFAQPSAVGPEVWPKPDWWTAFGSPELNALIVSAQASNTDIAMAAARVLQADAQTRVARSALFPSVDLGLNLAREGARDSGQTSDSSFGLVLEAKYEADFWGLARNNLRAAQAQLRASAYARQVVALSVTSDVAISYFSVLGLRQRIAIARQNVELARRVLATIQRRVAGGLSSRIELSQQEALVAGLEAQIPALQQEEREALYGLAVLLGRVPEGFAVTSGARADFAMPAVAPGLASELLQRRPDIAQAEANLAAADANVAAARAAFFPTVALTLGGGVSSGEAFTTLGATGLVYNIGASVLQTVFDAGWRQGQRRLAEAQQQELVAAYRAAILQALFDVERSLALWANLAAQAEAKRRQVQSAGQAFADAERLYTNGFIDLLALLQTQQTLFHAQDEALQVDIARLQAAVSLYKALGGGWISAGD
jgi:multidrug efflux system outer membrane protein